MLFSLSKCYSELFSSQGTRNRTIYQRRRSRGVWKERKTRARWRTMRSARPIMGRGFVEQPARKMRAFTMVLLVVLLSLIPFPRRELLRLTPIAQRTAVFFVNVAADAFFFFSFLNQDASSSIIISQFYIITVVWCFFLKDNVSFFLYTLINLSSIWRRSWCFWYYCVRTSSAAFDK